MEKFEDFGEAIDPLHKQRVTDALLYELQRVKAGDPPTEESPLCQLGERYGEWNEAFARAQWLKQAARICYGSYWELTLSTPSGRIFVEMGVNRKDPTPVVELVEHLMWARIDPGGLHTIKAVIGDRLEPLPCVSNESLWQAWEAVRTEILWRPDAPSGRGILAHVGLDYLVEGMICGQIGVGFRHEAI